MAWQIAVLLSSDLAKPFPQCWQSINSHSLPKSAAIIYHFRRTESLEGVVSNYLNVRAQLYIDNICFSPFLSFSLLHREQRVMVMNWNIAYQCEIYGENFNKYRNISTSFIDGNTELNWLKLICTGCGLKVRNEQWNYGTFST